MNENRFIGYEYQDVTVKRGMASLYADCYENFGWRLESTASPVGKPDSMVLKFKRDRKIFNKAELTRLQRSFNACFSDILSLESSKYTKASIVAYVVGILGTAFMAGSVFAITAGKLLPCILLALPAFIGWILPYFLYRGIVRKQTAAVSPAIEQKYDELYDICEKASGLLRVSDLPDSEF